MRLRLTNYARALLPTLVLACADSDNPAAPTPEPVTLDALAAHLGAGDEAKVRVLARGEYALDSLYQLRFDLPRAIPLADSAVLGAIDDAIAKTPSLSGELDVPAAARDLGISQAAVRANVSLIRLLYRNAAAYEVYISLASERPRQRAGALDIDEQCRTSGPWNPMEKFLLAVYPERCVPTATATALAVYYAHAYELLRSGDLTDLDGKRANALQHSIWNMLIVALNADHFSEPEDALAWAADFTQAHEWEVAPEMRFRSAMDVHNNARGRQLLRPHLSRSSAGGSIVGVPAIGDLYGLARVAADGAVLVTRADVLSQYPDKLIFIRAQLQVVTSGSGAGHVASPKGSIACERTSSGETTGRCAYDVDGQEAVLLVATPAPGSAFAGWSAPCASADKCSFVMEGPTTIEARFDVERTHTIATSSEPLEAGSTTGDGQYSQGSTAKVTASASSGFSFVRWSEDGATVSTEAEYSFLVTKSRALVAVYSVRDAEEIEIRLSASPTKSGTVFGGGRYRVGSNVRVSAEPGPTYVFVGWDEGETRVSAASSYDFVAQENRALVARFAPADTSDGRVQIAATSAPAASGTVGGAGDYAKGAVVELLAEAGVGYAFAGWYEAGVWVSAENPLKFTATEDRQLVANFVLLSGLTLIGAGTGDGSAFATGVACEISQGVATGDCSETYASNVTIVLTAYAAQGSSFVGWAGACNGIGPCTLAMNEARAVTARFDAVVPVDTLVSGVSRPYRLATSREMLFWVEDAVTDGAVRGISKTGGTVTTIASGLGMPIAVAADESYVYWLEWGSTNGRLKRAPIGGGTSVLLATGLRGAQGFLAQDAGFLYFSDGLQGGGGAIRRIAKSGGAITTLVADNLNNTPALATDGAHVYFHDDRGNIRRVPVNGGAAATIGSGYPLSITVDATHLTWVETNTGAIRRMPKGGGSAVTVATAPASGAGIAATAAHVYWIDGQSSGGVYRVPIGGGESLLVSPDGGTYAIAVDETHVYWFSGRQGRLLRALR